MFAKIINVKIVIKLLHANNYCNKASNFSSNLRLSSCCIFRFRLFFLLHNIHGDRIDGPSLGELINGDKMPGQSTEAARVDGEEIEGVSNTGDKMQGFPIVGDRIQGLNTCGVKIMGDRTDGDKTNGDKTEGSKIIGDKT